MRKFWFTFTLTILSLGGIAQQLPVYSQYFNNPYIYNPAFAGSQNAAYLYLNHRQQWVGLEGAPVTSSFSFNTPAGRRAAIGINMYTDKRGLLKTSSALASFGYKVPLGYDHFIRFGLSAGLGSNSIDFSQVDNIQDPAVLRLLTDNIFLDGQFGIIYQLKNLNLGFALPKLYETAVFSENYFDDIKVGRLKRYLFSGSYKIDLSPTSSLEPMAIYRITEGLPDFIEGGIVLNLKEVIWLGGSYRMNYGATALLGFNIKDNLSLGYAYEYSTSISSSFMSGTHEVQLGIRLGKHKDPNKKKEPKPVVEPIVEVEPPKEDEKEVEKELEIKKDEIIVEKPVETPKVHEVEKASEKQEELTVDKPEEKLIEKTTEKAVVIPPSSNTENVYENKPVEVTVKRGKHPLELEKGNYVISGVFTQERNAKRYRDAIIERGFTASYGYNSENKYFYVYLHSSDNKDETKDELMKYRNKHEFKDSWLLTVENDVSESSLDQKEVKEEKEKVLNKDPGEAKVPKGPKPDDLGYSLSLHEEPVNVIIGEDQMLTVQKGNEAGEMERGYYIIKAVFKEKDKAQNYSDRLFKEGINSKLGYNSDKKYYYIYLKQTDSEENARKDKNKITQEEGLKEVWILEVE